MLAASCTGQRRIKGSRESVPGDAAYSSFQKSCCCPSPSFNPHRAQLWAHLVLPNRAENVSFPNETLQQGAQAKWRNRSVQRCCNTWARIYPGHQLTHTDLTGTAVPATSKNQALGRDSCSKSLPLHWPCGDTACLHSCPNNSLLGVNTGIQVGLMRHPGSSQLDLFPRPTLPPTTENKCSFWLHQPQRSVLD